jgi:hypothetical protein
MNPKAVPGNHGGGGRPVARLHLACAPPLRGGERPGVDRAMPPNSASNKLAKSRLHEVAHTRPKPLNWLRRVVVAFFLTLLVSRSRRSFSCSTAAFQSPAHVIDGLYYSRLVV